MGLPIWRNPDEDVQPKNASKTDRTATARSSIRRRPSVHGRRANRPRLPRETSRRPRLEQSPPATSAPFGLREARRSDRRAVPPVSTLLESADGPPARRSRLEELENVYERERHLTDLAEANYYAWRLEHEDEHESGDTDDLDPQSGRSIFGRGGLRWVRSPSPIGRMTDEERAEQARTRTLRSPRRSTHRLSRAPSPGRSNSRIARQRDGNAIPTPPRDVWEDSGALSADDVSGEDMRRPHPLRHSWRAESPINGLGDRDRSPTLPDGWEIMRTTITPDATLPSAESSFASAAASHSFTAGGRSAAEPERSSSSEISRRTSAEDANQSDSVSSVDPDDLVCNDEEREATASFAQDMYWREYGTSEGRGRISRHRESHAAQGTLYALSGEPDWVEIGFRLINEALDTEEGRARVFQLSQDRPGPGPEHRNFEQWIFRDRRDDGSRRTRRAHIMDDEPPSPHPERYDRITRAAVRQATDQVHNYFRRVNADAMMATESRRRNAVANSPPPRYEPLASHPDVDTFTSRDAPDAPLASPPGSRSHRDLDGLFIDGETQDLDGVRRIVERLAQREDIPDEWWTSVGLARHLQQSRSRERSRSPGRRSLGFTESARVRTGRVERSSQTPRL